MTFALEINNVTHGYNNKKILNDINLRIKPGEIVSLVGPSGCGKSTLLNIALATLKSTQGEVLAGGLPHKSPNRHVGIVYQDYSLYSWLSARKNVAFGLKVDSSTWLWRVFCFWRWSKLNKKHLISADAMLNKFGLGECLNNFPSELSGGQQQRTAIARALIMEPKILLLDEPFSGLDESTREDFQRLLLELYQENIKAKKMGAVPPNTILLVTHELREALYVSSRVLGLSQYHGDGTQNGARIVYDHPAPIFHPEDPRDFQIFEKQLSEIRESVFNEKQFSQHKELISLSKQAQVGV